MTAQELQEEELEVLRSIYDGDPCFKEVTSTTFQYKIGEDGHRRSFVTEVGWGENYPDEMPKVHLDAFYNKHINTDVKTTVVQKILAEGEAFLGCAMTYTLFEYAKENAEELMAEQPENALLVGPERGECDADSSEGQAAKKKEKKEHLTKSQKRRIYERFGNETERPRGWDWMDIVKHLSRTGSQAEDENS